MKSHINYRVRHDLINPDIEAYNLRLLHHIGHWSFILIYSLTK
jgi:hypothetical protein